ncbi:MAG: hypothetical protein FJ135_00455 [Deltaproteobacteria bacterium]|nr:hypothetical protein [Deltaproteobacteria bacterium]
MESCDILNELKKLAPPERLAVLEAAVQQLREEIAGTPPPKSKAEKRGEMAAAAEALRADYAPGGELTAFTSLDGEDFHAAG